MLLTNEPLERADRNGFIQRATAAFRLTGRGANTAANRCERVGLAGNDVRLFVTPLGNGLHITPGVGPHRAALAAEDLPGEVVHVGQFNGIAGSHAAIHLSYLSWISLILLSAAAFSVGVALANFSSTIFFFRTLES